MEWQKQNIQENKEEVESFKKNIKWGKTGNAKFRTSNKNPRGHKHEKNIKNNLRHCRGDRGIKTLLKIKF